MLSESGFSGLQDSQHFSYQRFILNGEQYCL